MSWFGEKEVQAKRGYRQYVKAGIARGRHPELVGGGFIVSRKTPSSGRGSEFFGSACTYMVDGVLEYWSIGKRREIPEVLWVWFCHYSIKRFNDGQPLKAPLWGAKQSHVLWAWILYAFPWRLVRGIIIA